MKTFEIEIIETLSRVIEIEAEDRGEAIETVRDNYHSEHYILDGSDFADVDFIDINEDLPQVPFKDKTLTELHDIYADYLYQTTQNEFEFADANKLTCDQFDMCEAVYSMVQKLKQIERNKRTKL